MSAQMQQNFEAMLNGLNSTQRESVLSDDNTLQILAGPGSGKTRVLTCRVAYFVIKKQIQPKNIVVVTFTNKAASEMKKRLDGLIGPKQTADLMIGTFHSICCRILRQHAGSVQLEPNFTVADTDLSKKIIERLRKDRTVNVNDFTRKKMSVGAIWGLISKAKNKGETCHVYAQKYGSGFETRDIATLYIAYERELKKLNLVDFDNLLIKACEVLRKRRYVLTHTEAILVDEYQDTNIVQYDLIKLMYNQDNEKCLTIVGDPDQSIYGFRSAEPENFFKMQEEYANTAVINMEQNYRSTSTILDAALHVISHDNSRIDKSLHTDNPIGKPILKIQTSDESTQAQFVAKEIRNIIDGSKGMISYKDFAVLMRMNATSQQFEHCFRANKIPFTIVGGDRFFNRVEVKDILAYLRFAYNPKDGHSFARIINVPKRGVGDITLQRIIAKNDKHGTNLLDTIMAIGTSNSQTFNHLVKESMLELGTIILRVKDMIDNDKSVRDVIEYILGATKYFDYLQHHYFVDHDARWANIGELISIAQQPLSNEMDSSDNGSNDSDDDGAFSTLVTKREHVNESTVSSALAIKREKNIKFSASSTLAIKQERDSKSTAPLALAIKHEKNAECSAASTLAIKQEKDTESAAFSTLKIKHEKNAEFSAASTLPIKREEGTESTSSSVPTIKREPMEPIDRSDEYLEFIEKSAEPESKTVSKLSMSEFLEYCDLCSDQKELEEAEGGKVVVATLHASKGLEWPCVFIATCNEGVIPHSMSESVNEECRLLYVGMTRAKFLLYCLSPELRNSWGGCVRDEPSHFLDNLDETLYDRKPHEWNDNMRLMLGKTIGREVPKKRTSDGEAGPNATKKQRCG